LGNACFESAELGVEGSAGGSLIVWSASGAGSDASLPKTGFGLGNACSESAESGEESADESLIV
jgi:hypothetical protein